MLWVDADRDPQFFVSCCRFMNQKSRQNKYPTEQVGHAAFSRLSLGIVAATRLCRLLLTLLPKWDIFNIPPFWSFSPFFIAAFGGQIDLASSVTDMGVFSFQI